MILIPNAKLAKSSQKEKKSNRIYKICIRKKLASEGKDREREKKERERNGGKGINNLWRTVVKVSKHFYM